MNSITVTVAGKTYTVSRPTPEQCAAALCTAVALGRTVCPQHERNVYAEAVVAPKIERVEIAEAA